MLNNIFLFHNLWHIFTCWVLVFSKLMVFSKLVVAVVLLLRINARSIPLSDNQKKKEKIFVVMMMMMSDQMVFVRSTTDYVPFAPCTLFISYNVYKLWLLTFLYLSPLDSPSSSSSSSILLCAYLLRDSVFSCLLKLDSWWNQVFFAGFAFQFKCHLPRPSHLTLKHVPK